MVTDPNFSTHSSPKTEATRSSIIVCVIVLSLLAASISWFNFKLHFNGFILNDYHEYCEIARNFYDGNGYSTSVLRPIAYKFFTTLPHPEVTRMPIYPYFLSLFFHVAGPVDNAIVLFNSICYVMLIDLIFFVALELSSSVFIGLLAALITAFMESLLKFTLTAEPNIFYAAAFAAFFFFYLKQPRRFFLHGVLFGVLYLIRANSLFVFIGFLLALFFHETDWRKRMHLSVVMVSGFAAGLIPYMARNYIVLGKPFFSLYKYSLLLRTSDFPSFSVWTQISNIDPIAYVLSHPAEIIDRSLGLFFSMLSGIGPFYKPAAILLIGIGLFLPTKNPRTALLKVIFLSGIIIQTILAMPFGVVPYYYMFFFPPMIAVATANAKDHLGKITPIVLIASLVIFVYTTIPYWQSPMQANPFIPIGKQVAAATKKSDIILTDMAWEVTWYADRRTVWLPYDLDTLKTISKTLRPKYALIAGFSYAPYKDNIWNHMLQDPAFARSIGFELVGPVKIDKKVAALLYKAVD